LNIEQLFQEVAMILRYTLITLFLSLLMAQAAVTVSAQPNTSKKSEERRIPVNILSIIPAQGEPGGSVTLYGNGFSEGITAYLGNTAIPARVLSAKHLSFEIPKLDPGLYALYLKRNDGTTSNIYNFTLLPLRPLVTGIQPDKISACDSGGARDALISGRNFLEQSMVMFDGAAIGSRFISPEAIAFTVPDVQAGLHQVQVRNPGDAYSTVMALFIDSKPEITSISRGDEYVNYYNLIIDGRNFQQNSSLIVDGNSVPGIGAYSAGRDKFVYVNCNRIIYERYPYDTSPKNIRLQIINANGESSPVIQITAP
jgi:hypothetical protein